MSRNALRKSLTAGLRMITKFLDWMRQRLILWIEALEAPKIEFWFDPRQMSQDEGPTGHELYAAIQEEGLLSRSISEDELYWYEAHPNRIPSEFRGKVLCAWASVRVIHFASGEVLSVQCLDCRGGWPRMTTESLNKRFGKNERAVLHAA